MSTPLPGEQGAQLTGSARADYVRQMFARIVPRYDLFNTVSTFGQDARWRRMVVDLMYRYPTEGWFDDHPDASGDSRDGSDPALRPTAGFTGTPAGADHWPGTSPGGT